MMDRDFDDKLTFGEFLGEESYIEKLFKSMDKNGDGFVTKKVATLFILYQYITKKPIFRSSTMSAKTCQRSRL